MYGAGRSRRSQWGWHRLRSDWAERLVTLAEPPAQATVLDIGAGNGAITDPLVRGHCRVIAFELDVERARALRSRFGHNVTVVRADAADLRLPRHPFHVVANPPFSITSQLLNRLLSPGSRLQSAHLVLQLSAARHWANGEVRGAERWRRQFEIEIVQRLPRKAFIPPPHVDIAVLRIRRRH